MSEPIENLTSKIQGLIDESRNGGHSSEATADEVRSYLEREFIAIVKEKRKKDKVLADFLTRLSVSASAESLEKGDDKFAALLAAIPLLFHTGRDPNEKPKGRVENFDLLR